VNQTACDIVGKFKGWYFGAVVQEYNTSDASTTEEPIASILWTPIPTPTPTRFEDYYMGRATAGPLPAPVEGAIAVYGPAAVVLIMIGLAAFL
jgi:hypothetical protein